MGRFTRWLCNHGKHDYSRWEIGSTTAWHGTKPIDVKIQTRECIRESCGYTQIETIMIKTNVGRLH
jgi:hypothetical protein